MLAILLLHRGETVSVDRIVDLVWGERPPATAVKTVQVYVSHLRRALVDDVLVSSRGGYALVVEPDCIDAARFERLVEEGRAALAGDDPARAAELLRAGLALWRGPPLADLAYERFVQDAVVAHPPASARPTGAAHGSSSAWPAPFASRSGSAGDVSRGSAGQAECLGSVARRSPRNPVVR